MKFGEALVNDAVIEWFPKYLNYRKMKKVIKLVTSEDDQSEEWGWLSRGMFVVDADDDLSQLPVTKQRTDSTISNFSDVGVPGVKEPPSPSSPSRGSKTPTMRRRKKRFKQINDSLGFSKEALENEGGDGGVEDARLNKEILYGSFDVSRFEENERTFFIYMDREVQKINKFYIAREEEAMRMVQCIIDLMTNNQDLEEILNRVGGPEVDGEDAIVTSISPLVNINGEAGDNFFRSDMNTHERAISLQKDLTKRNSLDSSSLQLPLNNHNQGKSGLSSKDSKENLYSKNGHGKTASASASASGGQSLLGDNNSKNSKNSGIELHDFDMSKVENSQYYSGMEESSKKDSSLSSSSKQGKERQGSLMGMFAFEDGTLKSPSAKLSKQKKKEKEGLTELRTRMQALYRLLELTANYKELNIVACFKTLKKFDKKSDNHVKQEFLDAISHLEFIQSNRVDLLRKWVENVFRWTFCDGNYDAAMRYLRTRNIQKESFHGASYIFGLQCGLVALLVSYIAQALITNNSEETHVLALIYAGFSLPFCMGVLFAPVTYLLQSYRINYITIIGFDHTQCLHPFEFGIIAGAMMILYMGLVLLSLGGYIDGGISPLKQPWLVIGICLAPFLNWTDTMALSSRKWLHNTIKRLIFIPSPVQFRDFFMADLLMSMGLTINSLCMLLYYTDVTNADADVKVLNSAPFITWYGFILPAVPSTIRLVQCLWRFLDGWGKTGKPEYFPHMANFTKYTLGLTATMMAHGYLVGEQQGMFWGAFVAKFISTCASCTWDLLYDFGFLHDVHSEHPLLREVLNLPPYAYYCLMAFNVFARFLWLVPVFGHKHAGLMQWPELIAAPGDGALTKVFLIYLFGFLEMVRRMLWTILRIDNEFASDCQALRAFSKASDKFFTDVVEQTAKTEHNVDQHHSRVTFTSYHNVPTAAEEMLSSNVKDLSLPKNHPKRNNSMTNLADVLVEAKKLPKQKPEKLDSQLEETTQLLLSEEEQGEGEREGEGEGEKEDFRASATSSVKEDKEGFTIGGI